MREIEKKMVAALRNGTNFNGKNTQVECQPNGNSFVRLFGNTIYKVVNGKHYFNLCGWNSATTRSRLNALGVNVTSKNHYPHFNGKPMEKTHDWIPLQ